MTEITRREIDELHQTVKDMATEFKTYRHATNNRIQEVFGDVDRLQIDFGYIRAKLDTIAIDVRTLMTGSNKSQGVVGLVERLVPWVAIAGTVWIGLR